MKCIERLKIEDPTCITSDGIAIGCPHAYGYVKKNSECKYFDTSINDDQKDLMCRECWERECTQKTPPCKLGDTVYTVFGREIFADTVRRLVLDENEEWSILAHWIHVYQKIGQKCFTTLKEAEACINEVYEQESHG